MSGVKVRIVVKGGGGALLLLLLLLLGTDAIGDITSKSDEELVDGSELFWSTDIDGNGTRIEVMVLLSLLISDVIQTLDHSRVIRRINTTLFHVVEKLVDIAIIMATL